jgi:hypothetical protein
MTAACQLPFTRTANNMRYFPQLTSGAVCQLQTGRAMHTRTVLNRLADGSHIAYQPMGGGWNEWSIRLDELTADETAALRSLHAACQGRVRTFVFFDPLANLLRRSNELDHIVWDRDPALTLWGGIAGPVAGSSAWSILNAGAAAQRMTQAITAPSSFYYCLSAWLRGAAGTHADLVVSGAADQRRRLPLDGTWRRVHLTAAPSGSADLVRFGIELPAGGQVDCFGFQAEAQTNPGPYKVTTSHGGVYAAARFGDDALTLVLTGPGLTRSHLVVRAPRSY